MNITVKTEPMSKTLHNAQKKSALTKSDLPYPNIEFH